jgi:hypothetical protein
MSLLSRIIKNILILQLHLYSERFGRAVDCLHSETGEGTNKSAICAP